MQQPKMSSDTVRKIRQLYATHSVREIAKMVGYGKSVVHRAIVGDRHRNVPGALDKIGYSAIHGIRVAGGRDHWYGC